VARKDWLIGDRSTVAAERIYSAAMDLISRRGYEAFDIEDLAARVHCSRATVYRHVGGKQHIRDVVIARAAERIVTAVHHDVQDLTGRDRVVRAILIALHLIRTDPLGRLLANSLRGAQEMGWLTEMPMLADFAATLTGVAEDDDAAGQWIVRVVLALVFWPVSNQEAERDIVNRFVGSAFAPA
jgi:AcrR family transcriptional regulator